MAILLLFYCLVTQESTFMHFALSSSSPPKFLLYLQISLSLSDFQERERRINFFLSDAKKKTSFVFFFSLERQANWVIFQIDARAQMAQLISIDRRGKSLKDPTRESKKKKRKKNRRRFHKNHWRGKISRPRPSSSASNNTLSAGFHFLAPRRIARRFICRVISGFYAPGLKFTIHTNHFSNPFAIYHRRDSGYIYTVFALWFKADTAHAKSSPHLILQKIKKVVPP